MKICKHDGRCRRRLHQEHCKTMTERGNRPPLAPYLTANMSKACSRVYCVYFVHKKGKKVSIVSITSIVSTTFAHELHTKWERRLNKSNKIRIH
jgi:hypothetical protein